MTKITVKGKKTNNSQKLKRKKRNLGRNRALLVHDRTSQHAVCVDHFSMIFSRMSFIGWWRGIIFAVSFCPCMVLFFWCVCRMSEMSCRTWAVGSASSLMNHAARSELHVLFGWSTTDKLSVIFLHCSPHLALGLCNKTTTI